MGITIEVARDCSFCPGVERAIRITEKTLTQGEEPAYSFGPLIHNPEVVSRLRARGLEVLDPNAPLPDLDGIPVVIRSHGIDAETQRMLESGGAVLVDATCPTVKRAQEAARELERDGYRVVVLGSAEHPEVRSIVGRVEGPVVILESKSDARSWLEGKGDIPQRVGLVCQTTIPRDLLKDIGAVLETRVTHLAVRDTVCESAARHLKESLDVAGRVDLMVVVGGHDSSNTTRLAAACARVVDTRHIENPAEVLPEWLKGVDTVGVTGGASTPGWQIEKTVERLRTLND